VFVEELGFVMVKTSA